MTEIELYSAILCPFAHRCRLTLLEKGISFNLIEIDLRNKPVRFDDISPYGKVPLLKHGDTRVWESSIINEYLDEVFPEQPLLPKVPSQRAQARIWINFADTRLFATTSNLLHSYAAQKQTRGVKELTEHLLFIEREGLTSSSDRGPYWFGSEISLVDLTYYPWFEQWSVLEHYLGLRLSSELVRIENWWNAMANRESVRAIAKPPEFYIEHYAQLTE
jgi:glutathione S-transferase